jgi:hypothetical protein
MESTLIILFVQAVISAILSNHLADKKGYEATPWALAGFFFGVLGLIAAAGLPLKQPSSQKYNLVKNCPDCAETILLNALVCKYCGKKFEKDQIVKSLTNILTHKLNYRSYLLQPEVKTEKIAAINALSNFPEPEVVPVMLRFVSTIPGYESSSSYAGALVIAIQFLKEYNQPGTSIELSKILNKSTDLFKVKILIQAISSINDPACLPYLLDSLNNTTARDLIAEVLPSFGTAALPYLEKLSTEGSRSDAKLAQQIIQKINTQQQ